MQSVYVRRLLFCGLGILCQSLNVSFSDALIIIMTSGIPKIEFAK